MNCKNSIDNFKNIDMSKYILKTKIKPCKNKINLDKYILKTSLKECPIILI